MSGTSADGLDIAHLGINPKNQADFTLLDFITYEYSPEIRKKILDVSAPNGGNIEDVCNLNFFLAHLFSNFVLNFLQKKNIRANKIDFIGSHGQTVCHLPKKRVELGVKYAATLQIGDPSIIANRTGILTVGDFRIADMALGGEGAPLVPFFDFFRFGNSEKNRLILNIGGIANITFLSAGCDPDQIIAFDTGPGNVLIDSLTKKFFGVSFDKDGLFAQQGVVDNKLLEALVKDDYFRRKPPKSTGREKFAGSFFQTFLSLGEKREIKPENLIATATELTARTIFDACEKFIFGNFSVDELIISGGGAKNPVLTERLCKYFSASEVMLSDKLGIPGDAKEAMCFAILAYQTLLGKPSNIPSATGASRQAILGKICLPG